MKFKDLKLYELYDKLPLHLAHWMYPCCTCCATEDNFDEILYKDNKRVPFGQANYVLFKVANNVEPFGTRIGMPDEDDIVCKNTTSDYPKYYDICVSYGGPYFKTKKGNWSKTKLQKLWNALREQVGPDYILFEPEKTGFCAILVHKNDTRNIDKESMKREKKE